MSSLLLISGGLDSAAVAAIHKPTAGLFVDYGQRPAAGERRAARDVCAHLGLELHEVAVDLTPLGAGLLNPRGSPLHVSPSPEWYPYRNQFLVTIAAARALALGHDEIWIGLVAEDETRHADGTTQFVGVIDALLRLQEGRPTRTSISPRLVAGPHGVVPCLSGFVRRMPRVHQAERLAESSGREVEALCH